MATLISPQAAHKLIQEQQAVLIDVREPDELRSLRVPSALLQPLSVLDILPEDGNKDKPAVYFCRSGRRTTAQMEKLDRRGHAAAYVIDGGILAWQQAGLPVASASTPMAMERQVRMVAGGCVLLFVLLGQKFPFFRLLAGLIGAGLLYSGISGTCGLAVLLKRLPWNRNT